VIRLQTYLSRVVRLFGFIGVFALVVAVTVVVVSPQIARIVSSHESTREQINLDALQQRSVMYDRYGNQMAVLQRENRIPVKLADVSPHLTDSVIAVEDADFYGHKGVNLRAISRALLSNVDAGGVAQGGSTITQQVVKNSVVGNERTISRKLREGFLAVELEKQLTKSQILERYLNTAYFGHNAYGVQAAAQTYFNKNAKDLDWAESALLASLISNPSLYDPILHPARAFEQRKLALERIAETHKLDKQATDLTNYVPLPTVIHEPPPPEGYFTQDVVNRLLADDRLGSNETARYNAIFRGGLRIYTTYDPKAQAMAEQGRNDTMPGGKTDGTFDVARDPTDGHARIGTAGIVSIEPGSGAVRVMVGGVDPNSRDPFNLADNSTGRQAGSSFKPFVLAEGMEKGLVPADSIDGTGPCFGLPGYEANDKIGKPPQNFGGEPGVVADLTTQTQLSSNCAFLRLGLVVGAHDYIDMARRMGVTSTKLGAEYTSAAIGTNSVTPFDMASAYSVFANDGIRNAPYLIERVEDSTGKVLFKHEPTPQRVMSVQSARLVTQILKSNVERGTGTAAQLANGQPAAGKTGTTENATDLWFVGFTPQMTTSVWMGAVEGAVPLAFGGGDATGGRYAAATWGAYMNRLVAGMPVQDFAAPEPARSGKYLDWKIDNGLHPPGTPGAASDTTVPTTPTVPPFGTIPAPPPLTLPPSIGENGSGGALPPGPDSSPTTGVDPTAPATVVIPPAPATVVIPPAPGTVVDPTAPATVVNPTAPATVVIPPAPATNGGN